MEAMQSKAGRTQWVRKLSSLIDASGTAWFRWHDSGDLLSAQHLQMIFEVCRKTPDVQHWLPTREYEFVQIVLHGQKIPYNMTIRLSAHMIGKAMTHTLPTSSVDALEGFSCPATHKDTAHKGQCLNCRRCWDRDTANIDYGKH